VVFTRTAFTPSYAVACFIRIVYLLSDVLINDDTFPIIITCKYDLVMFSVASVGVSVRLSVIPYCNF